MSKPVVMQLEEAVRRLREFRDDYQTHQQSFFRDDEIIPLPLVDAIDLVLDVLQDTLVDENCVEGTTPEADWEPCGICRIFPPRACAGPKEGS